MIILYQTIASSSPLTFCQMNMYPREKNKSWRKARLGGDGREKHVSLGGSGKVHEEIISGLWALKLLKRISEYFFQKWTFNTKCILKAILGKTTLISGTLRILYFAYLPYITSHFPSTLHNALYLENVWGWWIFIAEAEK